jgi:hypothetical protein
MVAVADSSNTEGIRYIILVEDNENCLLLRMRYMFQSLTRFAGLQVTGMSRGLRLIISLEFKGPETAT